MGFAETADGLPQLGLIDQAAPERGFEKLLHLLRHKNSTKLIQMVALGFGFPFHYSMPISFA
jgi:hypothetical protein